MTWNAPSSCRSEEQDTQSGRMESATPPKKPSCHRGCDPFISIHTNYHTIPTRPTRTISVRKLPLAGSFAVEVESSYVCIIEGPRGELRATVVSINLTHGTLQSTIWTFTTTGSDLSLDIVDKLTGYSPVAALTTPLRGSSDP
ncbi:hypothetical protein PSHT_04792 [Puccinia striiformis]|uniref:Uncharacterized protein n=1 Tax=Puccinia striiformis TaxID=27350 RepID=A0A2S4WC61_9BASI|nr:hypothetical protein PSHT_04792 [Puccinia striiformis]